MNRMIFALLMVLSPASFAGVTNGQPVNAATTNAAFMDKNTTTTFTTAIADIRGGIETNVAADSTTTGSNQDVTLSAPITIFTNASLASIRNLTLTNRANGSLIKITNKTGNSITVKYLTGGTSSKQINTSTGADLALANNSSLDLYYDTVNSKWQVASGGAGGANTALSNLSSVQIAGSDLVPAVDNTTKIGSSSKFFSDIFARGLRDIDSTLGNEGDTPHADGLGHWGWVPSRTIQTPNATGGPSQDITLVTGDSDISASGNVSVTTGNLMSGSRGTINLNGELTFNVASKGTAGHVWTSTDTFGSGQWAAVGNAATATALASDPTDCSSDTYATMIAADGNLTCASITNASTTATSSNSNSTIILRDGSGNFSAGTITAALTGNASTSTALASDPSDCASNTYATTIAASGNLTCASITNASTTATASNTSSTIVLRDGSGNFSAGTVTATLTGNSSTATALAANPSDCASDTYATTIAASGNLTCASITNASTTATASNTNSTIVLRDGSGNFSAGTVTAALTGNSSTATALAANPSDCASDTYATTIAASGNLTCSTVTNAGLAGSIAYSKLSLTGAILNADLAGSITASKFVDVMPKIVGTVAITAQTADAANVTLITPGANHYYRMCGFASLTTAATVSSILPSTRFAYTDVDSNVSMNKTLSTTSASNTVGTVNSICFFFYAKSGAAIQYSTNGYVSSGATAMQYAARWILEQMD